MDPILCTNAKAVNSRTAEALGNLHTPGYGPFVSPVNRMRNSAPRSTGKDPHVQPRGRGEARDEPCSSRSARTSAA